MDKYQKFRRHIRFCFSASIGGIFYVIKYCVDPACWNVYELDLSGLKKIGRSAVMMSFVPASHDCILSISTVCCAGQTYCRKQDEQYQDLLSYCTKETKNKGRMKKISFFMRPLRGTCPPSLTSRR